MSDAEKKTLEARDRLISKFDVSKDGEDVNRWPAGSSAAWWASSPGAPVPCHLKLRFWLVSATCRLPMNMWHGLATAGVVLPRALRQQRTAFGRKLKVRAWAARLHVHVLRASLLAPIQDGVLGWGAVASAQLAYGLEGGALLGMV